jgi:prolyl-tRNA synthetase
MEINNQGLTIKKEDNFTEWFTQLMLKADLADYSSVSGCIIFKPYSYQMWEKIQQECDQEFKKIGVKNAYFPLFIPESSFAKEKEMVADFSPEVAWVTHGGNTKLGERLAIRPTSEPIMYESYSKWIRSHRDLPLLINQWNNVVRWEFNNPIPFFRTREFLWNEMHTCFATEKEALEHGNKVMDAYNKVTEKIMAMPGIYGQKTDSEKFPGAVFTKKVHNFLPNGRIIENSCFHYDGQNFAKSYDIKFKDDQDQETFVYQNTHAITTRALGTMLALHSDNKGLVLPPKIAPYQIVLIPLFFKGKKEEVLEKALEIKKMLKGYDLIYDDREEIVPGKKFNEWELKGIPIRIELGPKDVEQNHVVVKLRNKEEKINIKIDQLKEQIPTLLETMQEELYEQADKFFKENIVETENSEQLIEEVKNKKMVRIPICDNPECEQAIKAELNGGKVVFIDPDQNSLKGKKCLKCQKEAQYWVFAGRTY